MDKDCIIFGLSASYDLAKSVAKLSNIKLGEITTNRFADNEIIVTPIDSVRGKDVVIIQSLCSPVNDNLMELLISIDAVKRASANQINVVIPYFSYSRQDRKTKAHEPITFKLVANLIERAGANRILTFDIHSNQTQGFFDIPFDSLEASWVILKDLFHSNKNIKDNLCVISPDFGSIKRSRDVANIINQPLVVVDKRRPRPNDCEITNILGDVLNKDCLIIDDMIDTGGTMLANAKLLKEKGAKDIYIVVTHGLFNNNAINKFADAIKNNIIKAVYVSDTIKQTYPKGFHVVSVDQLIADCIKIYVHRNGTVSQIFSSIIQDVINNG